MITILALSIGGTSEGGDFKGNITFEEHLNIINAGNGFGKSLIFSGIIWCLGLEPYLGNNNDTSIWGDAVIDSVELDGTDYKVISSVAKLRIKLANLDIIDIERKITGGNVDVAICKNITKGEEFRLYTSKHINENSSLMRMIFSWAGIDLEKVLTRKSNSFLYFENLAPLFFISQMTGWSELFADQVKKYGIIDVDSLALEHVLGLNKTFDKHVAEIEFDLDETKYRTMLLDQISRIQEIASQFTDEKFRIGTKSLDVLVKEFEDFSLEAHLLSNFNFSFSRQRENLNERRKNMMAKFDSTEESNSKINEDESLKTKREQVLLYKAEIRQIDSAISAIQNQLLGDRDAIEEIKSKLMMFSNLEVLKKDNVGLYDTHYECPTCSQDVNPRNYKIVNLSYDDVHLSVEVKKAELKALENSQDEKAYKLKKLLEEKRTKEYSLQSLLRDFEFLDSTFSKQKKTLLEFSNKIAQINQEEARLTQLNLEVNRVQESLEQTIETIKSFFSKKNLQIPDDEKDVLEKFQKGVRYLIKKITLAAFRAEEKKVAYDYIFIDPQNNYLPSYNGKVLKRYCSGSDHSKIVLTYLLALQFVSLGNEFNNHLGLTVFDEPIQQNPEDGYRIKTIEFFKSLPQLIKGQVIIFTKLSHKLDEEGALEGTVGFKSLSQKRFLNKVTPNGSID